MLTRIAAATPAPAPSVLLVEVVGDQTLAVVGLIVSALAAAVGAVAAVASWRAATAARRASQAGDEAAQYASVAAQAAHDSAELQRAAFETERAERRAAQATAVYVNARALTDQTSRCVVDVENRSDAPITMVEAVVLYGGQERSAVARWKLILSQANVQKAQQRTNGPPVRNDETLKGMVVFTDANGVRWRRRTGEPPEEWTRRDAAAKTELFAAGPVERAEVEADTP